jgi:sigma-B regulation protein RsbU (phosphoserine phosphatase)
MADVSGKGVAAAMVMAVARTIIRNLSFTGRSPADILTETNKLLVETNNQPIFVTIFLACYNIKDGSLLYANGGHNPAYKITRDGKLVHFGEATGTIVGMLEDLSYENSDIFIHPDEYLVLYTDGLPEARSPDGNFYGETHFQGALESNFGCSARDFCEVVVSEVTSFQARELNDDVTLLIMKRLS